MLTMAEYGEPQKNSPYKHTIEAYGAVMVAILHKFAIAVVKNLPRHGHYFFFKLGIGSRTD
jgi:hypothetical protein